MVCTVVYIALNSCIPENKVLVRSFFQIDSGTLGTGREQGTKQNRIGNGEELNSRE